MKQKTEFFFEDRGGEGPLAIYWLKGPYGVGIEADSGSGVGFFDSKGRLIAVQFDHIISSNDHQMLRFRKTVVEVTVKNGRVVNLVKSHSRTPKKSA